MKDLQAPTVNVAGSLGIETVIIVSADRPELLSRCLQSILLHCEAEEKPPRILVIESSRIEGNRDRGRHIVREARRKARGTLVYVGASERRAIGQDLISAGLPKRTVDSMLLAGTAGANRNLALLLTRGEKILFIDDDVICGAWRVRGHAAGAAVLGGHDDPRRQTVFESRASAMGTLAATSESLFAAHARWLGETLDSVDPLANEHKVGAGGCEHLMGWRRNRLPCPIRLTSAGVAGDCGVDGPFRALLRSNRHVAVHGQGREGTFGSREVVAVALADTITHGARPLGLCLGVDNRCVLPPFIPFGRNEDGVFAAMLTIMEPLALCVHLSLAVVHDSARGPFYQLSDSGSVRVRWADVILACLEAYGGSFWGLCKEQRLRQMAAAVDDLCKGSSEAFGARCRALVVEARRRQVARARARWLRDGADPYIGGALDRYESLVAASGPIAEWMPAEGDAKRDASDLDQMKASCRELSECLASWPELLGKRGLGYC